MKRESPYDKLSDFVSAYITSLTEQAENPRARRDLSVSPRIRKLAIKRAKSLLAYATRLSANPQHTSIESFIAYINSAYYFLSTTPLLSLTSIPTLPSRPPTLQLLTFLLSSQDDLIYRLTTLPPASAIPSTRPVGRPIGSSKKAMQGLQEILERTESSDVRTPTSTPDYDGAPPGNPFGSTDKPEALSSAPLSHSKESSK